MKQKAPSLAMETLLVVRELSDGNCCAYPLADPESVSFGPEEAVIDEQSLFLADLLAGAAPEVVSRFAFPPGTHLFETDVLIPRHDLPRRLQVRKRLLIPSAVIPLGRDVWVIVLPLQYMFHLKAGDDLETAIRSEVERLCRARELSPQEYLNLLPADRHRLVRVALSIDREEGVAGRGRSLSRELAERRKKKEAIEVLESVALSLHAEDRIYGEAPIVGRERELRELSSLLGGKARQSVLILGSELAGKTALFHEWLRAERKSKRERIVYASSGARLIAGMSGLGQWQERVRRVMLAAETLDATVYFEILADFFSDLSEGIVDIPSAMRSFLDEGRVRVVGELKPESLELVKNRFAGFLGAFSTVRLPPLTAEDTLRALEAQVAHHKMRDPEKPTLDKEALRTLMELVERYRPYSAYPGKAMRLLDTVRRSRERGPREPGPLSSRDVFETFSLETGIPLFLLREDLPLKTEEVTEYFRARIVGQAEAIRAVVEVITLVKANLQPAGKPLAAFLFIGPTGVGKTELAKCLASFLFGSPDRLVRFDMSEYQDGAAAERFIRGADRVEGVLTRRIRQQPFSVLLLDEIEKAHPAVLDLLLQVLGEARLTDARGKTSFFHNTILIMTSNLGASHRDTAIGMGAARLPDRTFYEKEIAKAFRPELVNRIDRVVTFHALSREEAGQVGALALSQVRARRGFVETGITLELAGEVLSALAEGGTSDRYGARALRRVIEDRLVAPAAPAQPAGPWSARGDGSDFYSRGRRSSVCPRTGRSAGAPRDSRYRGAVGAASRRRPMVQVFRLGRREGAGPVPRLAVELRRRSQEERGACRSRDRAPSSGAPPARARLRACAVGEGRPARH